MMAFRAGPIILIMMLSSPVFAQWEYGGKWIGNYTSGTGLAMLTDSVTGNTFVGWSKLNGGDYDIFIQCVDSAGYTLWDEGGMVVYEDDYYTQWYVSLLLDGEGGVFVVWTDYRNTPNEGAELYGQRISGRGGLLWDAEGMKLTGDSTGHTDPQLYSDGQSGFVAVYINHINSGDIWAQRVNSNGQMLWDSTGISLTTANYLQYTPKTCRSSDSTFITIWVDWRDSHDYDSDIYMQSFDLEGNVLWATNGVPAVHWIEHQGYLDRGHDVVADGQGGAVVVWVDHRLDYIGYPVLFADRFSAQGESMWQANGKQLGFEDSNRAIGCQVCRMGHGFLFVWLGSLVGFEATYTNEFGDFIWEDTVQVLDSHPAAGNLVMADSDSLLVYVSSSQEGGMHKFGSKVDITGNQYWPNEPFLENFPDLIQVALDGQGGMIAAWKNLETSDIEISRIYADGHVGGDTNTVVEENPDLSIPGEFTLFQNYPNPFNGQTVLEYYSASATPMTFQVFDILGREAYCATIVRNHIGTNILMLDLGHLHSGIYIARIKNFNSRSNYITMTLIK